MPEPAVELVGVYRYEPTDSMIRETALHIADEDDPPDEWAAALERASRELADVVLIELLVRHPDERFDVSHFGQPGSSQAAWLDVRLSSDGQAVVEHGPRAFAGELEVRLAFYLHYFDPGQPLRTSYGDLSCARVGGLPERLGRILPFEPVD